MRNPAHSAKSCGRARQRRQFFLNCLSVLLGVVLSAAAARSAAAQALPAAEASPISTGFSLPVTSGSLTYALSASETVNWGFFSNSTETESTNVSGDLGYISNSKRDPFSALLSGGHSFGTGGQPNYNFASAGLSQVIAVKHWTYVLSDNVSYLPESPAIGFGGLPGLGDIGISPVLLGVIPTSTIAPASQGVLTNYATRVDNSASGSFSRDFTAKTSLRGSAAYVIQRFPLDSPLPQNSGLDSNGITGGGGVFHAYTPRTTIGGNFEYSDYSFVGHTHGITAPDFKTQTATLNFQHQYTRKFLLNAAGGPQWTTIELGTNSTSLDVFVNVGATYKGERTASTLTFVRSTNAGYGVIGGARSDSVSYMGTRKFGGGLWAGSLDASYSDTKSLATSLLPSYQFHTGVVGVQVTRALPHSLSAFASYSLQSQSNHGAFLTLLDAFSGRYQSLAFGITYSPMPIHLGGR